jgi:hypothetical protein
VNAGLNLLLSIFHSGQCLKWIFGLPLFNTEEISESFIEDFMSVVPNDPRLKKFCDYICDNYIDETSKLNEKMWASSSISSQRTKNSCESFHSEFNKYSIQQSTS